MRRRNRPDGIERALVEQLRFEHDIAVRLGDDYLAVDYRNFLYGGWRHPKGHIVTEPHWGLIAWHEAHKARFCPICARCKLHNTLCQCGEKAQLCRRYVGVAPVSAEWPWEGEGEDAIRTCDEHGPQPWRKTLYFTTLAALPGNGWAKSSGGAAEFCSRLIGHRPWDGSLTDVAHNNWLHLIVCQTLSVSAKLNIQPKLETALGSRIVHKEKNSSGGIDYMWVKTPWGLDRVKVASQDQHARTAATVSPIEGTEYANVWVDEPPSPSIRSAYGRGLRFGLNNGAGVEDITATFFEGDIEQRAFVFDSFWNNSFRRGGPDRTIFVMGGAIHDNPALTEEDKRVQIAKFPEHEREARTWGIYEEMSGRILPDFTPSVHIWDDAQHDVRRRHMGEEPTSGPIGIIVDPHDIRPWQMTEIMVDEQEEWWVTEEWPRGDFSQMDHYRAAGVDGSFEGYAEVLTQMCERIPGGKRRVLWFIMDPAFGDSEKAGLGQTVAKGMREQGFHFRTDLPRDMEPGHAIIREKLRGSWKPGTEPDALHHPHLHVAKSCQNTIRAFLRYVWDHKKGKPGEAGKDQIDVLRYFGVSKPWYCDWRQIGQANARRAQATLSRMAAARPF